LVALSNQRKETGFQFNPHRHSRSSKKRQEKLLARVKALAKAEDLSFDQCWSLVMNQHPELRDDRELFPEPFAPHLMRQTELKKAQAELDRKKAERDSMQQQKKVTSAAAAPPILVRGMDVGLICPIFPETVRFRP
jgi:hypothetical protein